MESVYNMGKKITIRQPDYWKEIVRPDLWMRFVFKKKLDISLAKFMPFLADVIKGFSEMWEKIKKEN